MRTENLTQFLPMLKWTHYPNFSVSRPLDLIADANKSGQRSQCRSIIAGIENLRRIAGISWTISWEARYGAN
jgi:hypothetical protein